MDHNKNDKSSQRAGTMLHQKTNEDFNKKKPDPKDPNEVKSNPNAAIPLIGGDEITHHEVEINDQDNGKSTINGSE